FIRHGYVRTTFGRAKELQRLVEKLITLTKHEDALEGRRRARRVLVGHSSSSVVPARLVAGKTDLERTKIKIDRSLLNGEDLVAHLFDNVGPRFRNRPPRQNRPSPGRRRIDGGSRTR
ncbi:MAG: hypothetical protein C4320_01785, partial [Armatimonadota bacterium]